MIRKGFTELDSSELEKLADGFNQLWDNGSNNSIIRKFAKLHNDNFNGGIIHWSPAFLPWHRDFLRQLELALQSFDSTISLPYWDWTRSDSRDLDTGAWKTIFGGRSNSGGKFDSWSYHRSSNSGGWTLPDLNDIIIELRASSYFNYRSIEGGSHVPGHTWTGGTMASGESPLDPLFYLHHCNLDRLWAIWQMNNLALPQYDDQIGLGTDINPNPNVISLNQSMQIGTSATPSSVLNHKNMGYEYGRDLSLENAWQNSVGGNLTTGDSQPTT